MNNGTCNAYRFSVWAPEKKQMLLHIVSPQERKIAMTKDGDGYFHLSLSDITEDTLYYYIPDEDGKEYPDPASFHQPQGVHGPSQVIFHDRYQWNDRHWKNIPFHEFVIYELHVGTFTAAGTFHAILERLDELIQVGVNCIELMPVAQFPGERNWGYDGVYPYAVQNSYGGPEQLKRFVDQCHQKGVAVLLDVVYNHLGPEGNYFKNFAPYFTDKYKTPWGDAINYDDQWSDGVRDYFSNNAIYWLEHFHIDGLRLDAIHSVVDNGAIHFWNFLQRKVEVWKQLHSRTCYLVAESDYNTPRVIQSPSSGGYGLDAQWLDDFHHALYVQLDTNGRQRYEDFGSLTQLAKAYKDGFVHSGEYVKFRKRKHGTSSAGISGEHFVAFNMNHDQVGNRVHGERLGTLVDFERLKLAAAALMMSPYVPLLFMGEEYDDPSPFNYFVSHSNEILIKAVREGRAAEFANYHPAGKPPDPQAQETFGSSKLKWDVRTFGHHYMLREWYTKLISLRKNHPAMHWMDKDGISVTTIGENALIIHRKNEQATRFISCLINFSAQPATYCFPSLTCPMKKELLSCESRWRIHPVDEAVRLPETILSLQTVILPPVSVAIYLS